MKSSLPGLVLVHSVLLVQAVPARLRGAMDLVSFCLGLASVKSTRRPRGSACRGNRRSEGKGEGQMSDASKSEPGLGRQGSERMSSGEDRGGFQCRTGG